MLNLHQLTTASIAHYLNGDEDFSIRDFNASCNTLTDFMAHTNLCFSNIDAFLARLSMVSNQFPAAITKSYEDDYRGDVVMHFYKFLAGIYNTLTEDIKLIADQVRWPVDPARGDKDFVCYYSKSIFSVVPGKVILDSNNSAHVSDRHCTVAEDGDIEISPTFTNVVTYFRRFSNDPVYGNGKYGLMPYIMPFVPPSFSPTLQNKVKFEYVTLYNAARDKFSEMKVAHIGTESAVKAYNNYDGDDINHSNMLAGRATELENELSKGTDELAKLIYDMFQDIAFSYNEDNTLSLARKPYVSNYNR